MADKTVIVIGGGVAGLSAAIDIAQQNIKVNIVEKSPFLGGHAISYACKATTTCVRCGACMVEEKLSAVLQHPAIQVFVGSAVENITRNGRFSASISSLPEYINPKLCNSCGICQSECPAGAIVHGYSHNNIPFFALKPDNCLYLKDKSCTICQDKCPQKAIQLDAKRSTQECEADALVVSTGFTPFNPSKKPYGYGIFKNVITNLELERMLREKGRAIKPSDGNSPETIAFIQCVGSRDAALGHIWCSKICCGSALRMARRIQMISPKTNIIFFYIDVQTFGKNFQAFYDAARNEIRMIRAIPCDIYKTPEDKLRIIYYEKQESREELVDLLVLSVGIMPQNNTAEMSSRLGFNLNNDGFASDGDSGIFTAGTVRGPMSIAESISSAGMAALNVLNYLKS